MHPSKFRTSLISSLGLLLTLPAFAAEAPKLFKFKSSPECTLRKRVKMEWQNADVAEISDAEPFLLHETFEHPEFATFYANHNAYSALNPCFEPSKDASAVTSASATISTDAPAKLSAEKTEGSAEARAEEKKEEEIEEETESEFLHEARYRILEVTPAFGFDATSSNYKHLVVNNATTDGITTGGIVEYGLLPHISVGANIIYDHLSRTTDPANGTTTTSGMEDPKFFANYKTEFGNSEVRLSLLFNTSVAHSRTDADGNSNVATGGFTFTPALGYEHHLSHNIFGAQIAYDAVKGDTKHDDVDDTGAVTTTQESGGKALIASLFFEHRFRKGEYGIALQYANVKNTSEDGVANNNSGSIWTLNLYGEIEFNEKISILPGVILSKANFEEDVDDNTFDRALSVSGSVAARFKF